MHPYDEIGRVSKGKRGRPRYHKIKQRDTWKPFLIEEPPSPYGPTLGYLIHKELGSGTWAKVFQASVLEHETYIGREVALKCLRGRQECPGEISIQSALHHPNIVEFQSSFIFDGFTFFVMDLWENGSLQDMIKDRGCLTEPEVRKYTIQLGGVIKYLQSKKIIHRDIKPWNIGLDANMDVKISDFGLSTYFPTSGDRFFERAGTPAYMAPEIGVEGYDQSVDLWSLGITIYEMLVGRLPRFDGDICRWPVTPVVSEEAKGLVGALLVRWPDRLRPDDIMMHPFIADGPYLEMEPTCRTRAPMNPRQVPVHDASLLQRYCRMAGVGREGHDKFWPCVGTKGRVNGLRGPNEGVLPLRLKYRS